MFVFLATKYDKHYTDQLNAEYGKLIQTINIATNGEVQLPIVTSHEMDEVTIFAAFLSCFVIGVGNWLCARANVTAGLILAVLGAKSLSFFVTKTVKSGKEITYAKLQLVIRIAKHCLKYVSHQGQVNEVLNALEQLKKYIRMNNGKNPSREGLTTVFG